MKKYLLISVVIMFQLCSCTHWNHHNTITIVNNTDETLFFIERDYNSEKILPQQRVFVVPETYVVHPGEVNTRAFSSKNCYERFETNGVEFYIFVFKSKIDPETGKVVPYYLSNEEGYISPKMYYYPYQKMVETNFTFKYPVE